jgi:hypothetical protein
VCGENGNGQLGQGTVDALTHSSPVKVPNVTAASLATSDGNANHMLVSTGQP